VVSPRAVVRVLVFLFVLFVPGTALAREKLKVLVPEQDNLQYVAFWAARAGGSFAREQLDVEVSIAPSSKQGTPPIDGMLEKGEIDAAIATPAVYLALIAAKAPIVVVANLFANDPYALVVRREVAEARALSPDATLAVRVTGLKGLSIGYPPASFGRLRTLLASQGLDIDKDVKARVLLSRDQGSAFKQPGLDAAYLASPHLEKSVVGAGAWVLVNQARGEVPALANKQTHVFLVSRRMIEQRRGAVVAAVRAIADAERRIHAAQSEVVDALARDMPTRSRDELETALALYEPAVPQTPAVSVEGLAPALALIPEPVPRPELAGDLAPFVATELSSEAIKTAGGSAPVASVPWLAIGLGLLTLLGIVLVIRRRRAG
jgi:ABC-type nitrate/sulfonate/bicarbonate transport system substrate-binding protein